MKLTDGSVSTRPAPGNGTGTPTTDVTREGVGSRRGAAAEQRARRREARWRTHRYSVPYPVDGPKVSLGLVWFSSLLLTAYYLPPLAILLVVPVAAVAALQAAHAWSRQELSDRRVAALVAGAVAASSWFGTLGLGVATLGAVAGLVGYGWTVCGPNTDARVRFVEVLVRTSIPAAVAAGSLAVLSVDRTPAFVSLVLLVSAYECGDFLVGSGSANAIEGPIAGSVALGLVAVGLYLVLPEPFTEVTLPLFAGVAALCSPLGQIAGSALLPRGDAWAPALRRLDSYLVSAPLWLLLV